MPWPIVAAAAITAGAAVGGAAMQSSAAKKAANTQAAAIKNTTDLQKYIYDQNRQDTAPWREVGEQALMALKDGYPEGVFDPSKFDFEADPGYQFRMDQAQKAVTNRAAAAGNLYSGATLKAAANYANDIAGQSYAEAWNRNASAKAANFNQLASLANVGQTAVSQVNAAGQNMANQSGAAMINGAANLGQIYQAQGAAQAGMFTGIAGAANNAIQNYTLQQMLSQNGGSAGVVGGGLIG